MEATAKKLKTKDLIVAGAFAALYVVVMMVTVSSLGFIPVLYLTAPFILSVILGPIYMLYAMKVPKAGAILILSAAVGLLTSMGGMWFALLWSVLLGAIAQGIAKAGGYRSKRALRLSYCVFACTHMGPFWGLILAKESFLKVCVQYYGAEYAATIDALTPFWIVFVLIGIAVLGAWIGGALGSRLLRKHFEKAGVV